jgi:hypothetical protein
LLVDVHQHAVEGRDVHSGGVQPALERLHERRAGPGEGIEDVLPRTEVARQQHLDELRDELPQVRVQPVNVPRAFALG